ncbi:MAG TPA: ELWxxDGT repeat protein [Thermoanaerobaculia bacterium]|nr:ELWxxDGT repeat protein [Thermoanaerobaculia bacterium]
MRAGPSFLLALTLLVPAPALGQTSHLVKDINTIPEAQGSFPHGYVRVGDLAFFAADGGVSGTELWRTDGTVAGTFQLVDACPGDCSSQPVVVARTETSVFFRAFGRGFGPVDLWVTDGSAAGTVRLAGALLLPDSDGSTLWMAGQGVLYFAANDLVHGPELWRSDGTPAGTFQITDLRPGSAGSEPAELTELDGRLYFRADDGERGPALWTSDGTVQGTILVRDPLPGSASHRGPSLLRAAGRTLFFAAPTTQRRDGLWKSDGTPGGTSFLIEVRADASAPAFLDATVLGNRLLFVAVEPGRGQELWASDGTKQGTQPLTQFGPAAPFLPLGGSDSRLLPETPLGSSMIFRANDGPHGVEPWVTDGTRGGTRLLRDLCPGSCIGTLSTDDAGVASVAAGDRLFFSGNNGLRGFELWATDGTTDGTRLVRDLCRGGCSSEPFVLQAGDGGVFLLGRNERNVPQLWRSDGTSRGTVRLTGFRSATALAGPSAGISLGGTFLFSAGDDEHGRELWASDGTHQSARVFLDLNPEDFGGSFPTTLRSAAGKAWFFADDGLHGFELWASDGSEEGTVLVEELTPGEGPFGPPSFEGVTELAGTVFFVVHLLEPNSSLWRTEGTPGSAVRLTPPELRVVSLEPLRTANGRVFFVAADAEHGEELWTTDGTAQGTRPAADLEPGIQGSQPRSLTVFEDRLYFTAVVGDAGRELYRSDGTPEGTFLVKDIDPRPSRGSDPELLTVHAGRLYFPAADPEHGRELWSTDGTEAGTTLAAEITAGPDGVFMTHLVSTGPHLFFSGGPAGVLQQGLWVTDGTSAGTRQLSQKTIHIDTREEGVPSAFEGKLFFASDSDEILWRSDGTVEGTGPLLDANGLEIDEPEAFRAFDGRLYFTTGLTSLLYQTDGTPEGTFVVQSLASPFELGGEAASFELVTAGGRLLFRAWERTTGSELWGLEAE